MIWSTTTCVVFFAQLESDGGVGAWPIGVSGGITIVIAILAYWKRADTAITKTDGVFFGLAIFSLPLWYLTADPMWAVVVLTMVDLLGFGPTLRKAYVDPYSESLLFFGVFAARDMIAAIALEHYSVATVLFPVAIAIACLLLMLLIVLQRLRLRPPVDV